MSQYWILAAIMLPILGSLLIPLLPFPKKRGVHLYIETVVLTTSVIVWGLLSGGNTQVFEVVHFVDDLSNWYVRRSRERYWVTGMPEDKVNAYMTLYRALVTIAKISAPFVPFMAEEIYRNLVGSVDKSAPVSVHLCDFPTPDASMINSALEENMREVIDVVTLGRACRNLSGIKNRQPVARMFVCAERAPDDAFVDVIAQELNVKSVIFTDSVRDFTTYTFKPQLRTLGPKYGKFLGEIRNALAALDGNAAMDELNEKGVLMLPLSSVTAELTRDDLLIEMTKAEGFESLAEGKLTVVIDKALTPELIEEGNVRELISKIQTMRKDSGFEVTDHIRVAFSGNAEVAALAERNAAEIGEETLADAVLTDNVLTHAKEWNVNGMTVTISVEKV